MRGPQLEDPAARDSRAAGNPQPNPHPTASDVPVVQAPATRIATPEYAGLHAVAAE